jgi:DNA-binding transcriptional ArsR family regulator
MQSVELSTSGDEDVVRFMAALSEPKRYGIVCLLASRDEDLSCGAIGSSIGLSASLVTHHLSALEAAGVVERRKNGLWTLNRLRRDVLERHIATLSRLVG